MKAKLPTAHLNESMLFFDTAFEDLFRERSDEELLAIKKNTELPATFWRQKTVSMPLPAICSCAQLRGQHPAKWL
ncbi:hypothetical protein WDV93_22875 [Pantoea ananatis]